MRERIRVAFGVEPFAIYATTEGLWGCSCDGIAVLPVQFAVVTADRDVREFQVIQQGERVRLRVAIREGAAVAEASSRLRACVSDRLAALGVRAPQVEVEPCAVLERPPAGKLQMVVAER
jgi:phenylacetate-coenzyme A ligase PaaK-like adenylate-forming protein